MRFSEVVKQAGALLRDSGRVTYRTLKREFALDDEALEDLKFELIEGQELAVDKDGKMLVWTGGRTGEEAEEGKAKDREHQPPDAGPSAGERRQLTVMFCDLVGWTA